MTCLYCTYIMARRTSIKDYSKINSADDIDRVIKDKRINKRADKSKQIQRQRHYRKVLLRKLKTNYFEEE